MAVAELCFMPALELDRLIRAGDLSPVEITDAVLERIDRLNPSLAAYVTVSADLARAQAREAEGRARRGERRGALDGIPYSIKDLEDTAGVRTTYGSKWFERHVPTEDGVVAGRVRAAGGILLGKTNTPHFGHKDMSDNLIGPPCRNPWRLDRTSGGSSGGAASAVAAGLGPVAHGSDGAGSIRCPASLCGVVGLKPSFGRVPYYPSPDHWAARSHNGPITRTVRDAALMLSAIAGPDHRDPLTIDAAPEDYVAACDGDLRGLRVAWSPDLGYLPVDRQVRAITEAAARRFSDLGCTLDAPHLGWPDMREPHRVIWEVGVAARHQDRAREHPDWIEPSLMRMVVGAGRISALEYGRALLTRTPFYQAVRTFFDKYDLLLTPTMPVSAWPVEPDSRAVIDGRDAPTLLERLTFTFPFNLTGQPAATVPCGWTDEELPVGLQIIGRWHADGTVLRAAAAFEALQPWAERRPPTS
jgi:Asp-tRNA(Asn)/Glu-tRNA(Gln) amidotransferase A subunit family amidase